MGLISLGVGPLRQGKRGAGLDQMGLVHLGAAFLKSRSDSAAPHTAGEGDTGRICQVRDGGRPPSGVKAYLARAVWVWAASSIR